MRKLFSIISETNRNLQNFKFKTKNFDLKLIIFDLNKNLFITNIFIAKNPESLNNKLFF